MVERLGGWMKCMNCSKELESIDVHSTHVGMQQLVLCGNCDARVTDMLDHMHERTPALYRVLMGRSPDA